MDIVTTLNRRQLVHILISITDKSIMCYKPDPIHADLVPVPPPSRHSNTTIRRRKLGKEEESLKN